MCLGPLRLGRFHFTGDQMASSVLTQSGRQIDGRETKGCSKFDNGAGARCSRHEIKQSAKLFSDGDKGFSGQTVEPAIIILKGLPFSGWDGGKLGEKRLVGHVGLLMESVEQRLDFARLEDGV